MASRGHTTNGRVWDPLVRLFHWSLVAAFATAWLGRSEAWLHEFAGKTVLILIVARAAWGIIGPKSARFAAFVCGPREIAKYLLSIVLWRPKRYYGHNPAGAAMIVAVLAALGVTAVSGTIMSTTLLWGSVALGTVHSAAAYATLTLVAGHVLGVLLAGLQHHENLVKSMITGRKQMPPGTQPYLGRMDIRPQSLVRAVTIVTVAAAGWVVATTSLNASLWRMHKTIAAELQKTPCKMARLSGPAIEIYPQLAATYSIRYANLAADQKFTVPAAQALARRPQIDFSALAGQCGSDLTLAAAVSTSDVQLMTASIIEPAQQSVAVAKRDRETQLLEPVATRLPPRPRAKPAQLQQ